MISTKNLSALPAAESLKKICKAISVLDAIISQDWQYRYYSYNSNWSEDEECLQMRDGSGDEMHILFRKDGCVITGFVHELGQADKERLTLNLPSIFNEFIFGEPVKSIGTTFCIWTTGFGWHAGDLKDYDDGSKEMLGIFDGNPQTYIDWASDYFEENYKTDGISFETVLKIYEGEKLTKEMVLSIVDSLDDWEKLKKDLVEIRYSFAF